MYTITDVEELAGWIVGRFEGRGGGDDGDGEEQEDADGENKEGVGKAKVQMKVKGVEELWERVTEEELERDPCLKVMREETEEGKKVTRNGGRSLWRFGGGSRILLGRMGDDGDGREKTQEDGRRAERSCSSRAYMYSEENVVIANREHRAPVFAPKIVVKDDEQKSSQLLHFLYHILVILVCRIFFCSWKIPYISASDVGGPETC